MILDWGCGAAKVAGAIGMDNALLPAVDVVHDLLDFPYPFDDNSAECVYLNHVIEHFALADCQRILREAYRVLQPGGLLVVRVPHVYSVAAWADVTHKTAYTFVSGQFFDSQSPKAYYHELDTPWRLSSTASRVIWLNWKRYRLRRLDAWISSWAARWLDEVLKWHNWPGAADLIVKSIPFFFVEIEWLLQKPLLTPVQ